MSICSPRQLELARRIETYFNPVSLDIIDDSHKHAGHTGNQQGGGHFRVAIISDKFEGLNTLKRHQEVYLAVGDMMKNEIHALSISAKTWKEVNQ